MKKVIFFSWALVVLFSSCKKDDNNNNNNNNNPTWTEEQKAAYQHVVTLQEQASANYDAWMLTTDSLTVINQLQQFFAADTGVTWALITRQGISVQYNSGMRGGIFLNPLDGFEGIMTAGTYKNDAALNSPSIVNKKKVTFLSPNYWHWGNAEQPLVQHYGEYLPKVGMSLEYVINDHASLGYFKGLGASGIINISSHGKAWPSESDIQEVYVMTGEEENGYYTDQYPAEFFLGDILICETNYWDPFEGGKVRRNVYWVDADFITEYNDFSADTILFYGGFCFSGLGGWPQIVNSFAAGGYFGFDWAAKVGYCNDWADSLTKNMTDTSKFQSVTAQAWMGNSMPKSYFDAAEQRTVSLNYYGDPNLTLWRGGFYIGRKYGGGIIFYVDQTGQHGLIGDTILTAESAPWDCDTIWNVTATGYGTGMANTAGLAITCNANGAAHICNDLGRNGFNDWYLPSKDELNLLYLHKNLFNRFNDMYWSSSEAPDFVNYQASGIWIHDFQAGLQQKTNILSQVQVRAIRSF